MHAKGVVFPKSAEIARLRHLQGWTQDDLAEKANCSRRTVIRAEKGERLRIKHFADIAHALGCQPEELIAGRARPRRAPIGVGLILTVVVVGSVWAWLNNDST